MKQAVLAAFVFTCVCFPLRAHGADPALEIDGDTEVAEELDIAGEINTGPALALVRPDVFSTVDGSVLMHSLPVLTLLDGRRLLIPTELGRMGYGAFDIFPVAFLSGVEAQRFGAIPRYGSDAPGGVVNLRLKRMYTGGEFGVFYGKSGGKYGREDFGSYIIGGVGNDKFNITVGAAYQESEFKIPRRSSPAR